MSLHSQTNLVGFADIRTQAIEDWQQYRLEGRQYLDLAERAYHNRNKHFTAEILYNLIAMAIEKIVMSRLMVVGRLPYNHTMHDLVAALEQWLPDCVEGLAEPLRALDRFQDICDPFTCTVKVPTEAEIAKMLRLAALLAQRLEVGSAS